MPYALVPCAFEIIVMADFSDYAKSWSQPLETSPLPPMPIATKLGRVATYCEGLPPIKSYGTLTTWVFLRSCDKLKALDLHYHNSVATKLGRMVTFLEGLVQIKSHYPLITWLCEIMWQIKNISTVSILMATRFGSAVTYLEGLPPKESDCPLITWSCEIIWQIKNTSPLSPCLWVLHFEGC